jgi:hypothetical protein
LETDSDSGASGGQEYLSDNGIAVGAIHAESGICVHAGGQLPFDGLCGYGAGAAKVVGAGEGPTGGRGEDAEDDGDIDEVSPATRVSA